MWASIFEQVFSISMIALILRATTPILLAALGGLISDITGVTNIGLEGLLLISAFTSIAVASVSGNWVLGVICGVIACVMISFGMGFVHLKMGVDIIITGFAVNLIGSAATVFFMARFFGVTGSYNPTDLNRIPTIKIPFIQDIPILGPIVSGHNLMVWVALLSVVFCFIMLYRTPYGVHLRAVGETKSTVQSVGINASWLQYSAFMWSGFFVGLGGAFISMGMTSMFVKDMTAGMGFLALAVVLLGNRNPIGVLIGALIFGTAKALETVIQTIPNSPIPSQLVQVMPYVITIFALVIYAIRRKKRLAN